ncbi:hypothetical protein HanIR_Chr07g0314401 [Helianthus annuus]|nr:hypothetical protein HanIR_Chr07g0314401 [Helianthus annuus]
MLVYKVMIYYPRLLHAGGFCVVPKKSWWFVCVFYGFCLNLKVPWFYCEWSFILELWILTFLYSYSLGNQFFSFLFFFLIVCQCFCLYCWIRLRDLGDI